MPNLVPQERIEGKILLIRGQKVMLDRDLAGLYGVKTAQLKRQVKRNIERFPEDFMFILSKGEFDALRCQFGTLKKGQHAKYLPYAFTEQGLAMLSSILNSKRAIQINIQIMRVFIKIKEMALSNKELQKRIDVIERKCDQRFKIVLDTMRQLLEPPAKPAASAIGFKGREDK